MVRLDNAADAVFEEGYVEIDEQADLAAGELQVGGHLGDVYGLEPGYRLQLDDDATFYEEIQAVGGVETYTLEYDGQRHLPLDRQAAAGQEQGEARLIC